MAEVRVYANWRRLIVMRAPLSGKVAFPADSLQESIRRRQQEKLTLDRRNELEVRVEAGLLLGF